MRYIKLFEEFKTEDNGPITKPSPNPGKPEIAPPPTKPSPPKPARPIVKPQVDPKPKAKKKVTDLDVAKRFIKEMNNSGQSIKKYIE